MSSEARRLRNQRDQLRADIRAQEEIHARQMQRLLSDSQDEIMSIINVTRTKIKQLVEQTESIGQARELIYAYAAWMSSPWYKRVWYALLKRIDKFPIA